MLCSGLEVLLWISLAHCVYLPLELQVRKFTDADPMSMHTVSSVRIVHLRLVCSSSSGMDVRVVHHMKWGMVFRTWCLVPWCHSLYQFPVQYVSGYANTRVRKERFFHLMIAYDLSIQQRFEVISTSVLCGMNIYSIKNQNNLIVPRAAKISSLFLFQLMLSKVWLFA